jgi:hypothetical protein
LKKQINNDFFSFFLKKTFLWAGKASQKHADNADSLGLKNKWFNVPFGIENGTLKIEHGFFTNPE